MNKIAKQLEEANKLIFVKQYGEAERLLETILKEPQAHDDILIHIRRIELAGMLRKLDGVRQEYLGHLRSDARDQEGAQLAEICLALTDQHAESVPAAESVSSFQDIIKKYGPNAACYYGIGFGMEAQGNYERAIYNYEQALNIDPSWYVCYFGLSQIYYHEGDEKRGDHFFYLFEQSAPYNVYGNFETHRKLCQEFQDSERFDEAEAAIQALSEWWIDNKGSCPPEIQIYELLATAKISDIKGDAQQGDSRRARADGLARQVLDDPETEDGVLYFVAKVLEEFDAFASAIKYYKKILRREGSNPAMVQKIGSQFLSMGEYQLAQELFEEAYKVHPENSDVRFCLLVSRLKQAGVNVEEYLIGRERLRQLVDTGGDKVELLALLHSLMAKFSDDADVQGHVADVYLKLGNTDRSTRHYKRMYELDGRNQSTALKYAAFVMQYHDPDEAMAVLKEVEPDEKLSSDDRAEVYWLKANYWARLQNYQRSLEFLEKVLEIDPWNISYLVQQIINLTYLVDIDPELKKVEQILEILKNGDDADIDWSRYDQQTEALNRVHAYALVYARRKLRYLYANGADSALRRLVVSACRHDAQRGTYEFMKLLNTNFDSPSINWALGILFKELWQLQTASMWFQQVLMYRDLDERMQARAYLELADCYIWQNMMVEKSIEFAKLALDMVEEKSAQAVRTLAHAYLRSGKVRQARTYLEQVDQERDPEARFLQGLLHYRNGARDEANRIWKPLLTVRSESLRFHHIKQEILRFYFDGEPYLKAN